MSRYLVDKFLYLCVVTGELRNLSRADTIKPTVTRPDAGIMAIKEEKHCNRRSDDRVVPIILCNAFQLDIGSDNSVFQLG